MTVQTPPPDWSTPAGRALERLTAALRTRGVALSEPLIVFGSAPLQIFLDPAFLSADVDVTISHDLAKVQALVEELGMGKGRAPFYLEAVPRYVFRPGPDWGVRASRHRLNGVELVFPAPLDLLVAKLHRLDEKDLRAFELVRQKTGQPDEAALVEELRQCHEKFLPRPSGAKSDFHRNVERLWLRLFGHPADVNGDILQPVLAALRAAGESEDYLSVLRSLGAIEDRRD